MAKPKPAPKQPKPPRTMMQLQMMVQTLIEAGVEFTLSNPKFTKLSIYIAPHSVDETAELFPDLIPDTKGAKYGKTIYIELEEDPE